MSEILAALKGRLVVSCQAYPGEPMLNPITMTQVAQSAVLGGAAGIRAKGLDDISSMRAVLDVPLIGLVKVGDNGVYITPTLQDCLAVARAGADVVALDGTRRPRPDGLSLAETIAGLKERFPQVAVMADCGSPDDAVAAEAAGADILGTTLAGYTGEREKTAGPDFDCLREILGRCAKPVFAEGRIHTAEQAKTALDLGAWSVVVGTAITHPASLTRWFVEAL